MPSFLWSESVVEECAEKSTLHADARFAYLVLIVVELPEEDCRKEGGYAVCCGDAYPYSVCAPIVGEDEQEGTEEDELAADGYEDAFLGHADALEEVGCDDLESYYRRHEDDDFHASGCHICQLGIIGEHHDGVLWEELTDDEGEAHGDGGKEYGLAQHFVDSVGLLSSEVVACYGLHALADAHDGHDEEEGDAVDNAVGCYGYVASVFGQSLIDEDDDEAGAELHAEG